MPHRAAFANHQPSSSVARSSSASPFSHELLCGRAGKTGVLHNHTTRTACQTSCQPHRNAYLLLAGTQHQHASNSIPHHTIPHQCLVLCSPGTSSTGSPANHLPGAERSDWQNRFGKCHPIPDADGHSVDAFHAWTRALFHPNNLISRQLLLVHWRARNRDRPGRQVTDYDGDRCAI